jgi:hypothetical protein
MPRFLPLAALSLSLIGGCASRTSALEARAARDLECKDVNLLEMEQGIIASGVGRLYAANGCGKRATYRYTSDGWVQLTGPSPLNSPPPAPSE